MVAAVPSSVRLHGGLPVCALVPRNGFPVVHQGLDHGYAFRSWMKQLQFGDIWGELFREQFNACEEPLADFELSRHKVTRGNLWARLTVQPRLPSKLVRPLVGEHLRVGRNEGGIQKNAILWVFPTPLEQQRAPRRFGQTLKSFPLRTMVFMVRRLSSSQVGLRRLGGLFQSEPNRQHCSHFQPLHPAGTFVSNHDFKSVSLPIIGGVFWSRWGGMSCDFGAVGTAICLRRFHGR